jgi:hypothetical protein
MQLARLDMPDPENYLKHLSEDGRIVLRWILNKLAGRA